MLLSSVTLSQLELRLGADGPRSRVIAFPVDLDPLDLVRAGAAAAGFAGYFSSPAGRDIGAVGSAYRFSASGPDRLSQIDAALAGIDPGAPVMIGFGFGDERSERGPWHGFPAAAAVVPEVAVVRNGGMSQLVVTLSPGTDGRGALALLSSLQRPEPAGAGGDRDEAVEDHPNPVDYIGWVDEAVAAIRSGPVDKVVLARSVVVRRARSIDAFAVVSRLRDAHPGSWVYGWQEGDASFIGASPELLVARRGAHAHLSPLAGSAPRGADPEQDRRIGEALLSSSKDRAEHEMVVVDALQRLQPLVHGLQRAPTPELHRFASVQHLATLITGTTTARVLQLAGALHPTAAVGGVPRSSAVDLITRLESLERGWYAGGIGLVEPGGDGEIALGLRCALVRADTAVTFAGCGIVADSNPAAELEETRLKLRPVLEAL